MTSVDECGGGGDTQDINGTQYGGGNATGSIPDGYAGGAKVFEQHSLDLFSALPISDNFTDGEASTTRRDKD